MKKAIYSILFAVFPVWALMAQNAWINEIHYDNSGTDADEFIEVVIENPGNYVLSNFKVNLYNGNNGASYDEKTLDLFTVGNTVDNFTFYYFNYTAATLNIQNGAPDGMSLSYDNTLITGQFLSYEGIMTATDGPASGITSTDIGVMETSTTPVGYSLQLAGSGNFYGAFTWMQPAAATPGALNNDQTIGAFNPDPEPSNYPTDFASIVTGISVQLHWTDATGNVTPAGYLVIASTSAAITPPVDGTPVPDDFNLSDGYGAANVQQEYQSITFDDLMPTTPYYFSIFPYTNSGQYIDYKTDGTAPTAQGTTLMIIHSQDFENGIQPWTEYSVAGDLVWVIDSIHGIGGSKCAKMSGYSGGTLANEDWLISPALNLVQATSPMLKFSTAMNYGTDPNSLLVLVSTNYTGGNPSAATWTDLTGNALLSAGNWNWTSSGYIDLSPYKADVVNIAFKYTSLTDAHTWEIDNIYLTGIIPNAGINETSGYNNLASLYPNPTSKWFFIDAPADTRYKLFVYSNSGSLLIKNDSVEKGSRIPSANLPAGVYLVVLQNIETGFSETHRLSVTR